MIYPWQQKAWNQIASLSNRIPNAWLMIGRKGIGKLEFAEHLAHALLCENSKETLQVCGKCPSCLLTRSGNHPDFYKLIPTPTKVWNYHNTNNSEEALEENKKSGDDKKNLSIKIEDIRYITDQLHLTSMRGIRKVVMINPAEMMTLGAANALLKFLEEPSESVIFILMTHNRARVLPTIKSRCQQFILPTPTYEESIAYLNQIEIKNPEKMLAFYGVPLFEHYDEYDELIDNLVNVLAYPKVIDILDFAAKFDSKKHTLALFLEWFEKWLIDLTSVSIGHSAAFYPQQQENFKRLSQRLKTTQPLFNQLYDKVCKIVPYGRHTLSVKLAIECMLIDYLKIMK